MDAAAFVICLAEVATPTSEVRVMRTYRGDINSYNRWLDKGVQFVISADGHSSHMGEHSEIDGMTIHRLNEWILKAISTYKLESNGGNGPSSAEIQLDEYPLTTTLEMDSAA